MVPEELTATCGFKETSVLFETFLGEEKTIWAWAVEQITVKPKTATARTCPQRLRRTMTNPPMREQRPGEQGPSIQCDDGMHKNSCLQASPAGTIGRPKREAYWIGLPR